MTKTGRDRRVARRATRRHEQQTFVALRKYDGAEMQLLQPTIEEIQRLAQLTPGEQAFNDQMSALGVPSFSEWFEKKGQAVIDRAAMSGKPGAFIMQQMLNPPKGVDDDQAD